MIKIINDYFNKSFEEKIVFTTFISIIFNLVMALAKVLLALFSRTYIFLVCGAINLCLGISKAECYDGIKKNARGIDFNRKNNIISALFITSGVLYSYYMLRFLLFNPKTFDYTEILGITIALVSFIEIGMAIYGILKIHKSSHFYRNIKIINLATASCAIVMTQIAILSFTKYENSYLYNGITGLIVGVFMIILGIFIIILPKVSMIDCIENNYQAPINFQEKNPDIVKNGKVKIIFSKSLIYGDYYYLGYLNQNIITGKLIHERKGFKCFNIYVKIIVCILSEILIFVWLIGRLISFTKNSCLPERLNRIMLDLGCIRIELPRGGNNNV